MRNPLNQYTDIANAAGARTLAYDGNGNLVLSKNSGTGAATGWGYDPENRLTSETTTAAGSTTTTQTALLAYDPLGRIYMTTDQAPATDVTTRFAYDGGQIIAEYSSPTDVARRYVHVPGSADEPILWYEGAGLTDKRYLHADERGSIVAITNAYGTVIGTNSYDEYGVPASTNTGRFQYTGQAWIPELSLYYYKARMYSPTLGRFMQTDPIGYGDGMNMYNYVGSDQVNYKDPTALINSDLDPHRIDGPGGGGGGMFTIPS